MRIETAEISDSQQMVRDAIRNICSDFDDAYWREKDVRGEYPHEFVRALGEGNWFGILVPEEYGGVGMSTPEVAIMMEEIAASGAGFSGAQAIHGGIYNSVPVLKYGSESMKRDVLPDVANGDAAIQSLGLTEPNAGSDSTSIDTFASRENDEYVINGQKIWISRLDVTDYLIVVARTEPKSDVGKRTDGISMFLVDVEKAVSDGQLEMEGIPKSVSNAVHAFEVWFDDLRVPAENRIGEEGEGFYYLLDGLNEERLVIAAECIGLGELALDRGVMYSRDRNVFDQPIGKNQAIQHPLAEAYSHIQAAKQMTYNAASIVDSSSQRDIGAHANMAKYLAAEACFEAADAAVQAHGGFGVAREYDVERYFREARLTRIVPVTQELALNYIGEKVLNLPRSY